MSLEHKKDFCSRTLAIIKPDITKRKLDLNVMIDILKAGFRIVESESRMMTREEVEWLYREHKGKDFFEGQVEFMLSGPVVLLILEKNIFNTAKQFRKFMGPTDKEKAKDHTLRWKWGTNLRHNAIHGSDSNHSASQEIEKFFPGKYCFTFTEPSILIISEEIHTAYCPICRLGKVIYQRTLPPKGWTGPEVEVPLTCQECDTVIKFYEVDKIMKARIVVDDDFDPKVLIDEKSKVPDSVQQTSTQS